MTAIQKIRKNGKTYWYKWHIAIRIVPILLLAAGLKYLANRYGYEILELNPLFTSLVAGTIFLIGFLISGVLTDYKESEKIPSDLAATLKNLFDDTYTIFKSKQSATAAAFMNYQQQFSESLMNWFYRREKTAVMLQKISRMNDFFADLDKEGIQPNYLIKMKNEQNGIRRIMLRVDTIRDTGFVGSAYAIVEAMGILISIGLIIIDIEPFYASLFLILLINFLIYYMFFLIKDLDNPFEFDIKGEMANEVSLKPLHDLIADIKAGSAYQAGGSNGQESAAG